MALKIKERETRLPEKGRHLGRCISFIDLGIQPGHGQYAPKHQVLIAFELPHLRRKWTDKEGQEAEGPERVCRFYTASLSQKAWLRKHLETWLDRELTPEELRGNFDWKKQLLNRPVEIRIVHKPNKQGDMQAKIDDVAAPGKGVTVPEVSAKLWYYSRPEAVEHYDAFPEWVQKMIDRQLSDDADEPMTLPTPNPTQGDGRDELGDEIPF